MIYIVIHLQKLEILDLRNNRFTRFPIELSSLRALKDLSLANNSIALLPRHIDMMSNLEALDLSRNLLRALPVEFTSVLESVAEVRLEDNPWTDLVRAWGRWMGDGGGLSGEQRCRM